MKMILHAIVVIVSVAGSLRAADDERLFESRVAPLLTEKCVSCHQPPNAKGGFDLTTREALLRGGDGGPGMVPGKPEESPIYLRTVSQNGQRPEMPEKGDPLTAREAAALREWIEQGAVWPEKLVLREKSRADASFWSLRPIAEVAPPDAADAPPLWQSNPVDRFVWQGLAKRGLTPNEPADARSFIRRATFDLLGLPGVLGKSTPLTADCQ